MVDFFNSLNYFLGGRRNTYDDGYNSPDGMSEDARDWDDLPGLELLPCKFVSYLFFVFFNFK